MKFLASLERSGELIAVKCLQRRERGKGQREGFCVINPLSLCLSASIDSFHSLLRSLFPCSPRCCTFLRNQIKHCLPRLPDSLNADRDLAHLQLLCFVSIPFIANFAPQFGDGLTDSKSALSCKSVYPSIACVMTMASG